MRGDPRREESGLRSTLENLQVQLLLLDA